MKNIIFGLQVVLIFSFTSCKQSSNDNESLISFTDQADTNTDQADTNNSNNAASNNEYDNTPVQFAMGSLEIIHTLNANSNFLAVTPVGFALSEDESKGVFRLPKSDGSGMQAELMLKDFNTSTVNRITEQSDASDIIVHGSGSSSMIVLGGMVGVSGLGNVLYDKSFLNLSDDGRYSYFNAHADSTFPDSNTNSPSIIYRKDLQTGDLDVVSDSANGHSDVQYITSKDSISDNGRYIIFTAGSSGSNGVLNDMFPGEAPANSTMAYLKDMVTNNIELVSKRLDGTAMTSDLNTTAFPDLVSGAIPYISFATTSNDGNIVHYVVNYDTSYDFETSICNVSGNYWPRPTVVRYDIERNERIVINPNNSLGSGHGSLQSLFSSNDGMVSSYVNTTGVVYYNHREGQLKDALVDENNNQLELSNMKYRVCDISPDGRFLGIISNNTALSGLTGSDSQQLYLKNLTTGEFQVVTYNSSNELFVEYVFNCQFTKDSKKITFTTKGNHYEGQDGSEYKFYRRQFRD